MKELIEEEEFVQLKAFVNDVVVAHMASLGLIAANYCFLSFLSLPSLEHINLGLRRGEIIFIP